MVQTRTKEQIQEEMEQLRAELEAVESLSVWEDDVARTKSNLTDLGNDIRRFVSKKGGWVSMRDLQIEMKRTHRETDKKIIRLAAAFGGLRLERLGQGQRWRFSV